MCILNATWKVGKFSDVKCVPAQNKASLHQSMLLYTLLSQETYVLGFVVLHIVFSENNILFKTLCGYCLKRSQSLRQKQESNKVTKYIYLKRFRILTVRHYSFWITVYTIWQVGKFSDIRLSLLHQPYAFIYFVTKQEELFEFRTCLLYTSRCV